MAILFMLFKYLGIRKVHHLIYLDCKIKHIFQNNRLSELKLGTEVISISANNSIHKIGVNISY